MEAALFAKLLQQMLSRPGPGAKRHIVRVASLADYRMIARAVKEAKSAGKRLQAIRLLPIIRAFSFAGPLPASLAKRFGGSVAIEEDAALSIHAPPGAPAIPAPSAPSSWQDGKGRRPFVPVGIRSLHVPNVWKRSLGARVRIGIIDTGVDFNHPDLQPVLSQGVNLVHPRALPYDDNGHGTHIAGTIAAAGKLGMSGIAPHATLLPVKAFDHNGSAYVSDIIKGIEWCVQHEVDIINMSFGMKQRSEAMLEAVRHAHKSGIVIVASSGNDGHRGAVDYPAKFRQTISVGAIDRKGRIASFSNFGSRIDVFAPGERVTSTWPNRRYHEMNGTSMATSHVTGILALVLSVRPRLTPPQLKRLIAGAQVPIKGTAGASRCPGRIDAIRAFRRIAR